MDRQKKVAIVTGASRGIGKQMALRLAQHDVNIVLGARTAEQSESEFPGSLKETENEIKALGVEAVPVKCDLSIRADVEKLCQVALERYGHVDYLLNNARYIGPAAYASFLDLDFDTWEKNIHTNLMAAVIASKIVLPSMMQNKSGMIICMTSTGAVKENPTGRGTGSAYSVTKAGLNRLVMALAKEGREYGIAVIAFDPGMTRSERASMESSRYGFDLSSAHSMDLPAAAMEYLCCTCKDPMQYTGQVITATDLVKQFNLK
jgi:NAD(P)-dependent dehydrogenase (short-subunit alcohol dehydrogenase family)